MRPKDIADDFTPTQPVIVHAIKKCIELGKSFENVCTIYPTAPFMTVKDLISSFKLFKKNKNYFCFPITEFPSSIFRSFNIEKNLKLKLLYPKNELTRTQDIKKAYYDCGQFYWGTVYSWLNLKNIHKNGIGFKVPNWRVIDLDTDEDWKRAELLSKVISSR